MDIHIASIGSAMTVLGVDERVRLKADPGIVETKNALENRSTSIEFYGLISHIASGVFATC